MFRLVICMRVFCSLTAVSDEVPHPHIPPQHRRHYWQNLRQLPRRFKVGAHPHNIVDAAVNVCGHVSRYLGPAMTRSFCLFTFCAYPNGHDPLPDCKHAAELLLSSPEEFKRRVRRHMQEVSPLSHLILLLLTLPFQHGTYIPDSRSARGGWGF
jgi:hypothetical protein